MTDAPLIAMWSGPRNLSTAMMYAFAQRPGMEVVDEPFYAAYLAASGLEHPMRAEILASQPQDADRVVRDITVNNHSGRFLKLMTQHMLPGFPIDWLSQAKHLFLLRHPARVVASYAAKRESPVATDLGFTEQRRIFDWVKELGLTHVVADSAAIRTDPEGELRGICAALDLPWTDAMLRWAAGGIPQDGVWADHWYGAVHRSTGFAGAEGPLPTLTGVAASLAADLVSDYEAMRAAL